MRTMVLVASALVCAAAGVRPAQADPVHDAAMDGDTAALKALLDNDPDLVRAPYPPMGPGSTPLHVAARYGQTEAVKVLLDHKADANAEARRSGTPLQLAVLCGHQDVAALLLARGATLDVFAAAGLGRLDDLRRLLKEGPKRLNAPNAPGDVPLHFAVRADQKAAAELLLSLGADASAKGNRDWTPLHYAGGHPDIVKLLLDHGADVEAKCSAGYTPLHDAAARHDLAMAKLLLAHGADVNARQDRQDPPDAEAHGPRLWTPLHTAVGAGNADMVELLAAKADLEARDWAGRTPLHLAVIEGRRDAAKALLRAGANIEARDDRLQTPLHAAAQSGKADMAELLLDSGAAVNATDADEWTPLHHAVQERDRPTAELLLKRKADVNAAARRWTRDAATGAVTAVSEGGTTPLHLAVSKQDKAIAELLINWGADVNARDRDDRAALALTHARGGDDVEMADLLRKHGGR